MATSTQLPAALAVVGNRLARIERDIAQLQRNARTAQLDSSSVDNGSLTFNDADGNPQLQIGLQDDGTHALIALGTASPPNAPSQPVVQSGINGIYVIWDGTMDDGSQPLSNNAGVQVHVSDTPAFIPDAGTLQGVQPGQGIFGVGGLAPGQVYYAALVAVDIAGNTSDPSAESSASALSVPASIPPGSIQGVQIATGSITGTQIAAATITAGLLAAGIIYAGIVDGTTIMGATVVADGTDGEVLVYNGTPANGNLLGSWSATEGGDTFGNTWPEGLVIGGPEGNQIMLLPDVGSAFQVTSIIGGITQAMLAMFTQDANEAVPGLIGSLILGAGTSSKMTTAITSPIGVTGGQGAALMLQSQNDGGTDTAVMTLGVVTTPDNSTEVFTPILTLTPYAMLVYGASSGQTTITYNTPGTHVFTPPAGVTSVKSEVIGPAGSGGNASNGGAAGGGGGGSYGQEPSAAVTPLSSYSIVITNFASGLPSTITFDSVTVTGNAGANGQSVRNGGTGSGGSGGAASGNTIAWKGGDGAGGTLLGGGGGGSSAGPGAAGANAVHVNGGNGPAGSGPGGDYTFGENGGPGQGGGSPGGGGAGAAGGGFFPGGPGGNAQGRITYSTGAPPILFSTAKSSGTDQFGTAFGSGTFISNFPSASPPSTPAGGASLWGDGGVLAMIFQSGLGGSGSSPLHVSGSFMSSVNGTSSITGTSATAYGSRLIKANDVASGTSYGAHASGSFTYSAVPSPPTFSVWWGGTAGVNIASLTIPAAGMSSGALSGAGWYADAEINWTSLTTTEVTIRVGWHNGSGVGGSVQYFVTNDTSGLLTSADQSLAMAFAWGSAPGVQSLAVNVCRISRLC